MSKSKARSFWVLVAVTLSFAAIVMVGLVSQQQTKVLASTVASFPSFTSTSLLNSNRTLDESTVVGHGYQLVNVWASWCGICKSEHQYLLDLQAQGVPIVGLNYRDSEHAANRYLTQAENPFREVIFDPKGLLAIDLGVVGTPETYLVDNEGNIVLKHSGRLTDKVWQRYFSSYFVTL